MSAIVCCSFFWHSSNKFLHLKSFPSVIQLVSPKIKKQLLIINASNTLFRRKLYTVQTLDFFFHSNFLYLTSIQQILYDNHSCVIIIFLWFWIFSSSYKCIKLTVNISFYFIKEALTVGFLNYRFPGGIIKMSQDTIRRFLLAILGSHFGWFFWNHLQFDFLGGVHTQYTTVVTQH